MCVFEIERARNTKVRVSKQVEETILLKKSKSLLCQGLKRGSRH